jgi:two-component system LytT family response regulator
MLKALIVDDEVLGAKALQILLNKYCPEVTVVGIAHSINEAEKKINELSPNVVFLDIAMPMGTGFDLLKRLNKIDFEVVFTTAYNNYAIKAIKHNALDYLLKPVRKDELITAVKKCKEKIEKQSSSDVKLEMILSTLNEVQKIHKLPVYTLEGIVYLETEDILYLEGDRNYTHIHLLDGKKVTSSKNLKEFEQKLNFKHFFRIHKTHIINLHFVKEYKKSGGGFVLMSNGASLAVSSPKKAELFSLLSN